MATKAKASGANRDCSRASIDILTLAEPSESPLNDRHLIEPMQPLTLVNLPSLILEEIITKLDENEKKDLRLVSTAMDKSVCSTVSELAWNACSCSDCKLYGAEMTHLPKLLLEKCHFLRHLDLGGNKSKDLKDSMNHGYYKLPPSLTRLTLCGTLIDSLDCLTQCYQMEKIIGDSSKLSSLSSIAGLVRLTTLSFQNTPIDSLTPLSHLHNLSDLNVSNTSVRDLGPLRHCTRLSKINLSSYQSKGGDEAMDNEEEDITLYFDPLTRPRSKIDDLSPLSHCTHLISIKAWNSSLCTLEGLPLILPNLTELDVGGTFIHDLSPLVACTSLERLRCGGWWAASLGVGFTLEGPKDLSPLSHCTRLSSLDCSYAKVEDVTPLTSCALLKDLNLQNNPLAVLPPTLPSELTSLILCETDVASLAPLTQSIRLRTLDVGRTPIVDLSPLAPLQSLTTLDLSFSLVSDLAPLMPCTRLTRLYMGGTSISNLSPVSAWPLLEVVQAASSKLSDLTPFKTAVCRVSLKSICLCNCAHVSDLQPLSSCKLLQRVCVDGTRVTNLMDLAGCRSLKSLKCGYNRAGLPSLIKLFPGLEVDPEPDSDDE